MKDFDLLLTQEGVFKFKECDLYTSRDVQPRERLVLSKLGRHEYHVANKIVSKLQKVKPINYPYIVGQLEEYFPSYRTGGVRQKAADEWHKKFVATPSLANATYLRKLIGFVDAFIMYTFGLEALHDIHLYGRIHYFSVFPRITTTGSGLPRVLSLVVIFLDVYSNFRGDRVYYYDLNLLNALPIMLNYIASTYARIVAEMFITVYQTFINLYRTPRIYWLNLQYEKSIAKMDAIGQSYFILRDDYRLNYNRLVEVVDAKSLIYGIFQVANRVESIPTPNVYKQDVLNCYLPQREKFLARRAGIYRLKMAAAVLMMPFLYSHIKDNYNNKIKEIETELEWMGVLKYMMQSDQEYTAGSLFLFASKIKEINIDMAVLFFQQVRPDQKEYPQAMCEVSHYYRAKGDHKKALRYATLSGDKHLEQSCLAQISGARMNMFQSQVNGGVTDDRFDQLTQGLAEPC